MVPEDLKILNVPVTLEQPFRTDFAVFAVCLTELYAPLFSKERLMKPNVIFSGSSVQVGELYTASNYLLPIEMKNRCYA